jgi:hypothetical protein
MFRSCAHSVKFGRTQEGNFVVDNDAFRVETGGNSVWGVIDACTGHPGPMLDGVGLFFCPDATGQSRTPKGEPHKVPDAKTATPF